MIQPKYLSVPIVLVLTVAMSIPVVIAQTNTATSPATATTSAQPTQQDQQIQAFKDKVAAITDQSINQKKRAYAGVVTSVKGNTIHIKNDNAEYDAPVEPDLTKFYQVSNNATVEKKLTDITVGSYVIITGPLIDNKISPVNNVYLDTQYVVKEGKITDVSKSDYYVKVITSEKDTYTLDIENYTVMDMVNSKTDAIERVGFSKFREGDTIHFVYQKSATAKDPLRVSATRVLIIPQEYFSK